jgi:hypothetical protein
VTVAHFSGKLGRGVDVLALDVIGDELFATGGHCHMKFWALPSPSSPGSVLSCKGLSG